MALTRFVIDGYGQLELNNVAFRRDGRVEAQCALDATDFADVPAENGMLLAVDRTARTVRFCEADEELPIALNYTTEHMYDERANALKDFALERGTFLPRLGYLSVGELFTTNCVGYDQGSGSGQYADDEALIAKLEKIGAATSPAVIYGGISEEGAIKLSETAPTVGPVLLAVEYTTMPDNTPGIKFQVVSA